MNSCIVHRLGCWKKRAHASPSTTAARRLTLWRKLRVPRGDGLQSAAMGETLHPHLRGLQQPVFTCTGAAWSCRRTRVALGLV